MFQIINLVEFFIYILIIAAIVAAINFIIGVILILRMASLKNLTKEKKPAIILGAIWSLVQFVAGFNFLFYFVAFLINLIIGIIAVANEEFYGLKDFRRRLKFLWSTLIIQLILSIIIWLLLISLVIIYFIQ
ncbi:MAG: hypothetical protein ACFFDN_45535 [Candidatus Hodarchaeota archaeon]